MAAAIKANLGGRYSVEVGGAVLSLRVEQNGDVSIFASTDKRPLARAPRLAAAESVASIPTRSFTSTPAAAAPAEPSSSAAPAEPSSSAALPHGGLDSLGALLTWLDNVSSFGLDGRDLGEVGVKSGSLTVEDLRNGQHSKFEKINLSLTRQPAGEVVLRIDSDNPERPWVLLAGVKPLGEGRRAVSIEARKIMIRDLLLALRLDDGSINAGLPMSISMRAELARDGTPQMASGQLSIGPGTITDAKDPNAHVDVERAEATL